jgi:CDP-6-deoxy-D-xylo-4-hexulose-3-dehydrase
MGDIATFSFFVAHNITTGEGGMILTDNEKYEKIARSLREFGRIDTDERYPYVNNRLKRYDKRYVFERLGWNVRMTDLTAAFGLEQLKKLEGFNKIRRENAHYFSEALKNPSIQLPIEKGSSIHTYYGYPIMINRSADFDREKIVSFLEEKQIETRPFMAGSLPDQPAFEAQPKRIVGDLPVSRWIRDKGFFIGCHPGIKKEQREYITKVFQEFLA